MQLIPGVTPLDQAHVDHAHDILRSFGPPGATIAALPYDQLSESLHKLIIRFVSDLIARMKASGAPEDALVDALLVAVKFDQSSTEAWNQGAFSAVLAPALRDFASHDMWWAVQRLCRLIGYISFHPERNDLYVQRILDAMEDALAPELARWPAPAEPHGTSSGDDLTILLVCDFRLADLSGIQYMVRFFEAYHRRFAERDRVYLVIEQAAITDASAPFRARLEAAGVRIVTYDQSAADASTPVGFGNLSSVCAALSPNVAVFYCTYCFALLASWCRLAPVQAFWTSAFDAAPSRQITLRLSPSAPPDGARIKMISGREWTVTPGVYTLARHPIRPVRRDGPLGRLGQPLFASMGGVHKFGNEAFVGMAKSLLSRFPEAAFVAAANPAYQPMHDLTRQFGIADRWHNIGFVDIDEVAPQIDVHLDTFPYGTAEASLRMLAHGCPTVGLTIKESLYGYIYHPLLTDGFGDPVLLAQARALMLPPGERPRLLIADTVETYIDLAAAVARDPAYRTACADAYRKLYGELLADGVYSVEAWRRALVSALTDKPPVSGWGSSTDLE